jgi:hypothetical protein
MLNPLVCTAAQGAQSAPADWLLLSAALILVLAAAARAVRGAPPHLAPETAAA